MLGDDALDAIFIVTRHHTHADLVCRALATGKAVFVEKPLALDIGAGTSASPRPSSSTGNDRLMVGFNRRFAPLLMRHEIAVRPARSRFGRPGTSSTRGSWMTASWYLDAKLAGSRFVGEGGHFIDTLSWWSDSLPTEVYAVPGPLAQDLQATIRFRNGSTGVISYLTGGSSRFPKETFDAAGGGRSARLDNFRQATVWSGRAGNGTRSRRQDKGQRGQLARFVEAVQAGAPMPITPESLLATTRATIAVGQSAASGRPEMI